MKKGLTYKQKKIIVGAVGATIIGIPLAYILYKHFTPPEEPCTVNADCLSGYECIKGVCKEITANGDGVVCSEITDSATCWGSGSCAYCKTDFDTPYRCYNKTEYPYYCSKCEMCFKTSGEYNNHNLTYHPTTILETITGTSLSGKQCDMTRNINMVFGLPHSRYIQTISGSLRVSGANTFWCGLTYVGCYVNLRYYLDGVLIGSNPAPIRVGDWVTISIPSVGKVGSMFTVSIHEITRACCEGSTLCSPDGASLKDGSMTFTVGLL